MTFTFDDLERIIEDGNFEGAHRDWFREIWNIVERRKLNRCSGRFEIIRFYRLAYQLCALYFGFTNVYFDCGAPDEFLIYLDIDYAPMLDGADFDAPDDPDCEESLENYILSLITEQGFGDVRELFAGISGSVVFASLYYCLNYEKFSFDDDHTRVMDEIVNEVDADKLSAYEWLGGVLGTD